MGWNSFTSIEGSLFDGIDKNNDVYFVHRYYAELNEDTIATCNYITLFSSALQKDNFYATQFHPEKSAEIGGQILKNFLKL
jgi:glutamine amidotransferase